MGTTVFANVSTPGPPGPAGPAGYRPQFIVAAGPPAAGVGNLGDMYIDSSTGNVYGPKSTGGWGSVACNIKGSTGATGATGPAGYSPQYIVAAGVPSGSTGNNGDMYINSTTSDVYGPKTSGSWGAIVCNIKGATGAQGPPGVAYTPKGAWSASTTYTQGDEATYSGQLYISLQSSNLNNPPSSSPAYWQLVASGGTQTPWLSNIDGNTFLLKNTSGLYVNAAAAIAGRQISVNSVTYAGIALQTTSAATQTWLIDNRGGADTPNNRLVVSTGGADIFTILPSGNIGIGQANPASILHIGGNMPVATLPGINVNMGDNTCVSVSDGTVSNYIGASGTYGGIVGTLSNHRLLLRTNNTERMRITATGGVSIGMSVDPSDKLEVMGGNASCIYSSAPQSGANNWAGYVIKSWVSAALDIWRIIGGSFTGGYTSFAIQNNGVSRLTIDNSGRVGISVAGSPTTLLEVNDGITSSGGGAGYYFRDRVTNTNGYLWYCTSNAANLYSMTNGTLPIQATPTQVGINIAPSYPFHVSGGRSFFQNPNNEPYVMGIQSSQSGNATWLCTDASSSFLLCNSGGTVIFTVTFGGNAVAPGQMQANRFYTINNSSQFGNANGGNTAPTTADANILFYDFSTGGTGNWAGCGSDSGGNIWFRAGLSGSPAPRLILLAGGTVGIAGSLGSAYALDVGGDVNVPPGGAYRINGVPITSGGGVTTQSANLAGSRSFGTTYPNSTGKPMMVTVAVSVAANTGATSAGGIYAQTDSANPPTQIVAYQMVALTTNGPTGEACITFWVLPGNFYKVSTSATGAPSIGAGFWTEWY